MSVRKGEPVCTGACLLGKCPNEVCVRYLQKERKAAVINADMNIMTRNTLPDIKPEREGTGVAVDIGTTTIVAYAYDCARAKQLAAASRINSQATLGVDVISRIKYCSDYDKGLDLLHEAVVRDINSLLIKLSSQSGFAAGDTEHMVITGNTTMLHLLAGLSPVSMGALPFAPASLFGERQSAKELGLIADKADVYLTPCMSAFVGGDITMAVLASGFFRGDELCALLDIGTNGEVALGNKDFLLVTSTAAGPAFEGAHISCGMAGVAGAVNSVYALKGNIGFTTINGAPPKGICGSGLLDATALMVSAGLVDETGRIADSEEIGESLRQYLCEADGQSAVRIAPGIQITQKDVREIQTAKAAIAAGLEALLHHAGTSVEDLSRIYVAGGFGNFMDPESAMKIGLLPKQASGRIYPIGNAAGTGAIMALLNDAYKRECESIAKTGKHVELGSNPVFMERYVENMFFNA